jgi:hypothetical protein
MIYPHALGVHGIEGPTLWPHPRNCHFKDLRHVLWKSQLSLALTTSPKCNAPDNVVKESMSSIPLLVPPQPAPSHVEPQLPLELLQPSHHNLGS